jgi:uncharacterized protein (TIGR02996 family)
VPVLTDADCMLRAVIARPEDDAPRLAFADWCDEHGGEARGEFIRVQVELAEIAGTNSGCAKNPRQGCRTCERIIALRRRESDLHMAGVTTAIYREAQAFGIGAVGILDNGTPGYSFAYIRRGFVAAVSLPAADFVRHAGELFGRWPIERVTLTDREHHWQGRGWGWYDPGRDRKSDDTPLTPELPDELYAVLCRLYCGGKRTRFVLFDAEEKSHAALSAACCIYGRELAGLPGGRPEGQKAASECK